MTPRKPMAIVVVAAAAVLLAVDGRGAAAFSAAPPATVTRGAGPPSALRASGDGGDAPREKGFFAKFFDELDAFVDDATSRRLGNGAQYYGKRKSGFYGEKDANRKRDRGVSDPTEDYRGPSSAGYFKWMPDPATGELKPVTRMKEKNIERKSRM